MFRGTQQLLFALITWASVGVNGSPALAASTRDNLPEFWQTQMNRTNRSPADYLVDLRAIGVRTAVPLVPYLGSDQFRAQALYSLYLLSSNSVVLDEETLGSIIKAIDQSTVDAATQMLGVRVLLDYYPESKSASDFLNSHSKIWISSPGLDDQMLDELGRLADRKKEKWEPALRLAAPILNFKLGWANKEYPSPGRILSIPVFLSAIEHPLYEDPRVGKLRVGIAAGLIGDPGHRASPEDFELLVNSLLRRSAGDSVFAAEKLSVAACGNTNVAAGVLYLLNEAKETNTIAKTALEKFSAQCGRNKEVLQAIQAGQMTRKEALGKVGMR